jgi:hypothetical protein
VYAFNKPVCRSTASASCIASQTRENTEYSENQAENKRKRIACIERQCCLKAKQQKEINDPLHVNQVQHSFGCFKLQCANANNLKITNESNFLISHQVPRYLDQCFSKPVVFHSILKNRKHFAYRVLVAMIRRRISRFYHMKRRQRD